MTDLERRALMGDKQAQEECTRQGIVLACPRCGKGGASTKYVMGDYWYECPHCHSASGFHSSAEVALADWNTRPAPPVGHCVECEHWYKSHCSSGPFATEETDADFYCSNFKQDTKQGLSKQRDKENEENAAD